VTECPRFDNRFNGFPPDISNRGNVIPTIGHSVAPYANAGPHYSLSRIQKSTTLFLVPVFVAAIFTVVAGAFILYRAARKPRR